MCSNDVAVLLLSPQLDQTGKPYYPGTLTGWYLYAVNDVGFTPTGITHITQLGYPLCLDNGAYMERNDTQGVVSPSFANNSVMGSLMCGGSSGGPLIINFGMPSQLTGTTPGGGAQGNAVIGVTSWGSTDLGEKRMGASPFLTTNLPPLIHDACKVAPDAHDGPCR